MSLKIKPIHLKQANEYIKKFHRHNLPTAGGKFAISCYDENRLCGVAICGRPTARNACSKLYGACCRIAQDMGYVKVITYILASENGASVKASNFVCEEHKAGLLKQTGARQKHTVVAPAEYKKRYVRILNNRC